MPEPEQRRVYRVAQVEGCRVDVRYDDGQLEGSGLDLSNLGLGASFLVPDDQVEHLPLVGHEVHLSIMSERLREPMEVRARTVRRSDAGSGVQVFGFEFIDIPRFDDPALHGLFNRRAAVRVEPDRDEPVEISLETQSSSAVGAVRDISTDGVGVVTEAAAEDTIGSRTDVSLELTFGPDDSVSLPATIRNRRLLDDGSIAYGLLFADRAEHGPELHRVRDYVMARQRDQLRHRLEVEDD